MPYPVLNLIEGRPTPATVRGEQSATEAVAIMIEKEYSQLPVVDAQGRPLGLVTFQSIVEATSSFGVPVKNLSVVHAVVKADEFSPDDDLFDVIDRLQERYAVLVVDEDGRLVDVVTTYDSTEYFRRRGEDLMLVEDIEGMLKDMILAAFNVGDGASTNNADLSAAIQRISDNQGQLLGQYRDALRIYLVQSGLAPKSSKLDQAAFDESFARFAPNRGPRPFENLTFYDYVELFLHDTTWDHFGPTLQLDRTAVRQLLEGVRNTRNHLAHFRNDLSAMERSQLRFCWNWLQKHQPQPPADVLAAGADASLAYVPPGAAPTTASAGISATARADGAPAVYEQPPGGTDLPASLLAAYFSSQPPNTERIGLRFEEIERIIRAPLPASARSHRSWWSNSAMSRSRLQRWLDAGWRVVSVNMAEQVATFERIPQRQRRLLQFFLALDNALGEGPAVEGRPNPPTGEAWHVIRRVPQTRGLYYIAAFAANDEFRIELYIDTGERERNNHIFDALAAQRSAIEGLVGAPLRFERMDDHRAARIAWVRSGSINGTDEELAQLGAWAADAAQRLARVLDPLAVQIGATHEEGMGEA
jgi:hypothetical protein